MDAAIRGPDHCLEFLSFCNKLDRVYQLTGQNRMEVVWDMLLPLHHDNTIINRTNLPEIAAFYVLASFSKAGQLDFQFQTSDFKSRVGAAI